MSSCTLTSGGLATGYNGDRLTEKPTMSAGDLIEQLKSLSNPERLAVIEAATRLVREELVRPA